MEEDLAQAGMEPAANLAPPTPQPAPVTPTSPLQDQEQDEQAPFQRLPANKYGPSSKILGKGSLVLFRYEKWKHDPYPLLLVSEKYMDGKLAGVNLHYLTFRYVKNLLSTYCNNRSFDYQLIKGDQYIVNAYRCYTRSKIKDAKMLDCGFLMRVLSAIRSYNPSEIQKMREEIQRQLRQKVNPKARDLQEIHDTLTPKDRRQDYGLPDDHWADGRRNPSLPPTGANVPTVPTVPVVGQQPQPPGT